MGAQATRRARVEGFAQDRGFSACVRRTDASGGCECVRERRAQRIGEETRRSNEGKQREGEREGGVWRELAAGSCVCNAVVLAARDGVEREHDVIGELRDEL